MLVEVTACFFPFPIYPSFLNSYVSLSFIRDRQALDLKGEKAFENPFESENSPGEGVFYCPFS